MLKLTILVCLISLGCCVQLFGFKFFEDQHEDLHADDFIQKGTMVTPEIQTKIKTFIEQAFIFNGNVPMKNAMFIQQQMSNLYGGMWVVGIYGSNSNYTQAEWGVNLGISSYSTNGQWWIFWKGANHYQPMNAYYLARQEGNSSNYNCISNYEWGYNSSEVFRNVVSAAEMDYTNIQQFTAEIQYFLHGYKPDVFPTVSAVNTSLPFYLCAWGSNTSDFIQRTNRQGLMVMSTPRVGY